MLDLARFHGISRLGVFLMDATTGKPLSRVPVYAEIEVGGGDLVLPMKMKGLDEIRETAPQLEPMITDEILNYFGAGFLGSIGDLLLQDLLILICDSLRNADLLNVEVDIEKARLETRAAIGDFAKRHNFKPGPTDVEVVRYPLGVLSSDHVGFVSFDLERARVPDPMSNGTLAIRQVRALVYPYMSDLVMADVVSQGRIASDAIVGKLAIDSALFRNSPALNLPALQNPSLTDWRLSPGSFAATPLSLVGADGCQSFTPANFATSQYHIRQVVRIDEAIYEGFPAARVLEYSVSFIPIGHSLGQVLYSLPLAPGESTRLAIINWRRQDSGTKTQDTIVSESLVHEQTRDRVITETVEAALEEWQRGGSVMGGMATGGGASANLYSIVGLAGGSMMSAGGGYSTSSGTRDLAVDTMQKVADRIHQASSAVRELHGTVVVQTDQVEQQNIETRAFANHNRGHTLNILYHEVLQHFRVVTEYKKRYAAVLMPRKLRDFNDDKFVLARRYLIEPSLLDSSLVPHAFDALKRLDILRKDRERNPVMTPPAAPWDGDIHFTRFDFQFSVGQLENDSEIGIQIELKSGVILPLTLNGQQNFNQEDVFDNESDSISLASDSSNVRWADIRNFLLKKLTDDDKVQFNRFVVHGQHNNGQVLLVREGKQYRLEAEGTSQIAVIEQPPPPPQPPTAPPSPEQQLTIEEYQLAVALREHLVAESTYYDRLLDLARDPNSYAVEFEGNGFGPVNAIDEVAPTPLEIMGSYIAFPLIDQNAAEREMEAEAKQGTTPPTLERIISLPTRGVFAEARLGHCNVAEEIDETRFWRWDEHPNPFMASEIAPVQPVTPQTIQLDLTGAELPNPIISIQNPPAAPDPTGMADALKLMSMANIFRDMSGRAEVAGMIKDLIDGSVRMAELAVKAKESGPSEGATGTPVVGGTTSGGSVPDGAPPSGPSSDTISPPVQQTPGEADRADIDNTARKLEIANKSLPLAEKKLVWKQATKELTESKRAIDVDLHTADEGMVLQVRVPGDAGIIFDNHEHYAGKAPFIEGTTSIYTKFRTGKLHLKFETSIDSFDGIQYVDDIPGLKINGKFYFDTLGVFNFGDADRIRLKGTVTLARALEVTVNVNGAAKVVVGGDLGAELDGIGKIAIKSQVDLGAGAGVQIKYEILRVTGLKLEQFN